MDHYVCLGTLWSLDALVVRDIQKFSLLNYFLIMHQSNMLVFENQFYI